VFCFQFFPPKKDLKPLKSFFEGNEGSPGRITQNAQVLTFLFGNYVFFTPSPARPTWNFQEQRLKNHLDSRLAFNPAFKVADRLAVTFSNFMLAVSGCSLGSVRACIGFHVNFGVIL
jgi:hypothetical protein